MTQSLGKLEVKLEQWDYGISKNGFFESLRNPKQLGRDLWRTARLMHSPSDPYYQATIKNLPDGEKSFWSKSRPGLASTVLYEIDGKPVEEIHVVIDKSFLPRKDEDRRDIVDRTQHVFRLYEIATGTKVSYELPEGFQ